MFYEVRVKDSKGNVKKVISPKVLSHRFWKSHMGDNQGQGGMRAEASDLDFDPKSSDAVEEE